MTVTATLTAPEIYVVLRDEGYTGSLRSVQRHYTDLRQRKPKERFFEQEYQPAEQSQFDFKEKVELPFVNGPQIVHFHFGTLPHSDFFHIKAYPYRNFEAFIDGIHSFFEKSGGMTEKIRFDNLAPCVKKFSKVARGFTRIPSSKRRHTMGLSYSPVLLERGPTKGTLKEKLEPKLAALRTWFQGLARSFRTLTT